MLLLFFFLPHSCATASDLRKRKTPSVRSSHLISPGFRSGFSRMSLMNSHKWVPLGSMQKESRLNCRNKHNCLFRFHIWRGVDITYYAFWPDEDGWKTFWYLREVNQIIVESFYLFCFYSYLFCSSIRKHKSKNVNENVNSSPGLDGVGEATGARGWIEGS